MSVGINYITYRAFFLSDKHKETYFKYSQQGILTEIWIYFVPLADKIGKKIVFKIVSVQGKIPEQVFPCKIIRWLFYRQ